MSQNGNHLLAFISFKSFTFQPSCLVRLANSWTLETDELFEICAQRHVRQYKNECHTAKTHVRVLYSVVCHSLEHLPWFEG